MVINQSIMSNQQNIQECDLFVTLYEENVTFLSLCMKRMWTFSHPFCMKRTVTFCHTLCIKRKTICLSFCIKRNDLFISHSVWREMTFCLILYEEKCDSVPVTLHREIRPFATHSVWREMWPFYHSLYEEKWCDKWTH